MRLAVLLLLLSLPIVSSHAQGRQVDAARLPGGDPGAQIQAAEAQLGAGPGTIVWHGAANAEVRTAVTLGGNHTLRLETPLRWSAGITLPAGSGGQTVTCPALQTLAFAQPTHWIQGVANHAVTLTNCQVASTGKTGKDVAIYLRGVDGLTVTGNHAEGLGVMGTDNNDSPGHTVESHNITVRNNTGSGGDIFIFAGFTQGGVIQGNQATGYTFGVYWWGGDSCVTGCAAGGGQGAAGNPRRSGHLQITGNQFLKMNQACIWGSMGEFLTITNNTCSDNGGGDVGIDLEGTQDTLVADNTVRGFTNGGLAAFFLATRNTWRHNTVVEAAQVPLAVRNATQNPAGLSEVYEDNTFTCSAHCTTRIEAAESLTFRNNHFTNVSLVTGFNESQVTVANNDFHFTLPAETGAVVITSMTGVNGHGARADVEGNRIRSDAPEGRIAAAISVSGTDFNNPQESLIRGNVLGGSQPFPVDVVCAARSGNSRGQGNHCVVQGNTLATGVIQTPANANTVVTLEQSGNHQAARP